MSNAETPSSQASSWPTLDYEESHVRGIPVVVDLTFLGATFGFRFD